MSEKFFDVLMAPSQSASEEMVSPLPGQVLMHLESFDSDYTEEGGDGRRIVQDIADANVITSLVSGGEIAPDGHLDTHKLVLDVDLPVTVLPSSTPGHYHLFIDKAMSWDVYLNLLRALAAAGVIEEGYFLAAERRQHTAVRLPWIKKEV